MEPRRTSSVYSDTFELDDLLTRLTRQAEEQHYAAISLLQEENTALHLGDHEIRYDQMVLENDREIDWWWSLLAKVFSWLLLAGYIVFPSTFASLRRSQVLEDMGSVGQAVSDWVNDCLIALASVLSGVASIGLAWLWFRWRANYVWVHQHIVIPTLANSLIGFLSTILNIYTVHGGQWSATSIATTTVTGWWLVVSCALCGVYQYLLDGLRRKVD
ncbi:hypothetical protein CGGC5_v005805 [Colletotrichum fructicola Nara gc5]|uniref:Uncharacterized protein n=1 Tax=Colletotrichum fructicola (strain Nara gc5) TaxID=1213859 RepID=A0A7J6IIT7_COLFN|nr:hypothetical protein CGGC5_v015941 [Colletotrichum fructicola Nara gc5]KAF4485873.1 hypothetical protein CGGC5_v005805 [Colletotrichum fructicola Nara gc5]